MGYANQRFDVNLSILFTELPLLERPAAAAAAGFSAVELWWPWVATPTPPQDELDALAKSLKDAGRLVQDYILCSYLWNGITRDSLMLLEYLSSTHPDHPLSDLKVKVSISE